MEPASARQSATGSARARALFSRTPRALASCRAVDVMHRTVLMPNARCLDPVSCAVLTVRRSFDREVLATVDSPRSPTL